jgi:hypothetical protein
MTPTSVDVSSLAFAPLFTTAKGAKQLPALFKDGEPVAWQPDDYMEIPFEPSAFGDPEAIRVTLCVTPSESLTSTLEAMDAWCIGTLIANPALLGIALTPEQVRERYSSSLKISEKGYTTVRAKMNRSGRYALQCYDSELEKRPHPETWRGCSIRPRLVFKGLWVMGKDFGCLLECTHALIKETKDDACPF